MSIRVRNACKPLRVKAPEKAVLMALADYASHDGGSIYPALDTLSDETCLCVRAIRNAVTGLLGRGVLKAARLNRGGRHVTNSYLIDLDRVAELIGQQPARNPAPHAAFTPQENPAPHAAYCEPDQQENPASGAENPARHAENPASGAADPSRTKEERELQANPISTGAADVPALPGGTVAYLADYQGPAKGRRCKATGDAGFDEFYAAYPRHKDPEHAKGAYLAALRRPGVTHAVIMQGVAEYRSEIERDGTPMRWVKHPKTWLNAGSYLNKADPNEGAEHGNGNQHDQRRSSSGGPSIFSLASFGYER